MVQSHHVYAAGLPNNLPHSGRKREQGQREYEDDGLVRLPLLGILVHLIHNCQYFNRNTLIVHHDLRNQTQDRRLDPLSGCLALRAVALRTNPCHSESVFKISHSCHRHINCLLWHLCLLLVIFSRRRHQRNCPPLVQPFPTRVQLLNHVYASKI